MVRLSHDWSFVLGEDEAETASRPSSGAHLSDPVVLELMAIDEAPHQ